MDRVRVGPGLNWQIIVPVVSGALLAAGLGMVVCAVVAAVGGDGATAAFAIPAAIVTPLAVLGVASAGRMRSMPLRSRDGFFAVTMAWVVAAAAGALPFLIHGTFMHPGDAMFESMSGFTTMGGTLIDEIEREPDAILLWRSISHWIGGIGIVVLVVAIAPATGLASQRVFYAETSGVTADRLTPRIADTAKIIGGIYLLLSALAAASFWVAGMTLWEAVNHSMSTIATGGFSTRTASIGGFDSVPIELVAIVFMAAGGINFSFYWLALRGRDRMWPEAAEVRAYLLILLFGTLAVTASLLLADDAAGLGRSLRDAAFAVTSVMTTTGFVTADFDQWPAFAGMGLLVLMFVGGCAGSTAGGMKVIRVMLLGKSAAQEVQRQLQPKAVQVLRTRGRVFSEEIRRGVFAFFALYVTVFAAGTIVMAALGLDLVTAASSVITTLNVTGPGLGGVGAAENFAAVPDGGRWFLTALMLVGRLEVFTVLVLLTPAFWRRNIA